MIEKDLRYWQDKFATAQDDYGEDSDRILADWAQYTGDTVNYDFESGRNCHCMRNLTFELIESQIDTSVPMPKVTAPVGDERKKHNAKVIEAMLKDFMKRIPAEEINDNDERMCKIFGSSFALIYWDDVNNRPGIRSLHSKQVIPQSGVKLLSDMDYVFVTYAQTKRTIKQLYDVDLDEYEMDDVVDTPDDIDVQKNPEELIEQVVVYYRNDKNGIGMFAWAGNTVLVDIEDYGRRSNKVCKKCGKSYVAAVDGVCPCGSREFVEKEEEFEILPDDIMLSDGETVIDGMQDATDEDGEVILNEQTVAVRGIDGEVRKTTYEVPMKEPTKIPFYEPKSYPILVRKNISSFDSFLGDGDCEQIRDLQIAHNRLSTKMQEKMLKGGSILTIPKDLKIETSDKELKIVRVDRADQMSMISAVSLQPSVQQDYQMLIKYYDDAKSTLGITDSYQGKPDNTANSGTAKQAAIQQASGRLLSKIKMKNAYYEKLYRAVFEYMLAYSDDTIEYMGQNEQGQEQSLVFNRYNFLEKGEDGKYYYDDDYIFEIDNAAALTSDRQTMWQEIRINYQSGIYGQPGTPEALTEFWKAMDIYDYPLAPGMVSKYEQMQQQQQQMQQQMAQQQMAQTPNVQPEIDAVNQFLGGMNNGRNV